MSASVLLVVDTQNDFCPGGALPVTEGDRVVPALNAYIALFHAAGYPLIASRDWHPARTTHFNTAGGPWPPHCVQGTRGAAFHPDLALPADTLIVSKGMGATEDAYSAFQARDERGRSLATILHALGVRQVYLGGLTLDYCVKETALDAIRDGLAVTVLLDATRAVNVHVHDAEQAIEELVSAGVQLATLQTLGRNEAPEPDAER